MALTVIECPYCNNIIPTQNITTGRQWGFSKLFSYQGSAAVNRTSYNVACNMCGRTYKYFHVKNYQYLKAQLFLSDYAIETFNTIVERCGLPFNCDQRLLLDWAFDHAVGVTSLSSNRIHICFNYEKHRFYFDCIWQEEFLNGLNAYKVY